jgi:hypothetical protein
MDTQQVNVTWKQISIGTKMACGAREAKVTSGGKLQFKVGGKPLRFIEVSLNGRDLYDIVHFRVKRNDYSRVELESSSDVFAESMSEVIYHMVNK